MLRTRRESGGHDVFARLNIRFGYAEFTAA